MAIAHTATHRDLFMVPGLFSVGRIFGTRIRGRTVTISRRLQGQVEVGLQTAWFRVPVTQRSRFYRAHAMWTAVQSISRRTTKEPRISRAESWMPRAWSRETKWRQ